MNYLLLFRILLFILMTGFWYAGWWQVGGVVTLIYLFRYLGYEVVLLGLFLDIQFMTGVVPWYTIAFAAIFVLVEWCKPRLLAYTR